jgi:hypothetical protein
VIDMQTALRLETTILPGHRLEISAPELPEGARVEVIVLWPEQPKPRVRSALEPQVAPGATKVSGGSLEEQFRELVRRWKAERGQTSSAVKMAATPAYRQIVNLGKDAVPLLLAELERQPDHWFLALYEITGVDPVPKQSRGRINEMAAAWVQWGREHGFVW